MTNEKQTHHADCGDVGDTGEHGDLGSNAAGADRAAPAAGEREKSREEKIANVMNSLVREGYGKAKAKKMAEAAVDNPDKADS